MIEPKFLSALDVRKLPEGTWMLLAPLRYQSAVLGALLHIPAGFVTDFASTPRLPVMFWLFGDRAHAPAVLHDFLYQQHFTTKDVADDLFREAMLADGDTSTRRAVMWFGVHVGGQASWDSGPSRFRRLGNESGAAALLPLDYRG